MRREGSNAGRSREEWGVMEQDRSALVRSRDDAKASVVFSGWREGNTDVDEVAAHVSVVKIVGKVVVALPIRGAGPTMEVEPLRSLALNQHQRCVVEAVSLPHELVHGWDDFWVAEKVSKHLTGTEEGGGGESEAVKWRVETWLGTGRPSR